MPKVFAKSIFSFMAVMLLLSVVNIGCSSRHLDQNQKDILEQPEKNGSEQHQIKRPSAKREGMSIFTVIEFEDLEYPTLAASIRLPFRAGPNNTVVFAGEHAYLTTERHLHIIDVSLPQRPSYLTSLEFPKAIGKVLASGDHLVIATPLNFHLVNVSQPSHPVLEFTGHLPQQHAIKDLDVLEDHLYVMGENDYLYIFYAPRGHAQLVKTVELSPRWWLFSPKADRPNVQQVEASKLERLPSGISEALRSQRGFLQLRSSKNQKVRASPHCLVIEQVQNPMRSAQCDLLIYSAYTKGYDEQQKNEARFKYISGKDFPVGGGTVFTELYYVGAEGLHHLKAKEENDPLKTKEGVTLTRGKPKIVYAVSAGEMQRIAQDPSSETIVLNNKQLELPVGSVTDFQILDGLLYVVSANGFFSIRSLITVKEYFQGDDAQFISVTALQANRPISLAVGEGFAYVLATPENSKK
ncbi:hypothetical protein C6503_18975 [Candidatus Poribacteria bacterium]|nr:MAG: hypothetical protein C6503_18975 [Candidatus Poribacteria bacterium]